MKRFLPVAAALAAAFSMSAAQADVVIVDDFSLPIPGQVIADNTGGGATLNTANPSAVSTNRELFHELITPGAWGSNGSGNLSSAGTGALPNFAANQLNMNNANQTDSLVRSIWTLAPIVASTPAKFVMDVIANDTGTGDANYVRAVFNGVDLGLLVSNVGTLSWELNAAQVAQLAAGSTFRLTFNGSEAWDMAVDNLRLEIPEPASLALVGLALVGAGLASRRRKA